MPLAPVNMTDSFHHASSKMGVLNDNTQNPYRPKRMRSIFSSACYQAKIDDGVRHIFMGHKNSVSEGYREMPPANLEQIYAKVEPFVSVFDEDKSQELAMTRQKSEQALDLALDIREENKRLTELVANLAERLGQLDGLKERIEALEEIGALPEEKEALKSIPEDAHVMTEAEKVKYGKRQKE